MSYDGAMFLLASLAALAAPSVTIDRQGRTLYLLDEDGTVLRAAPVGIGRGGLATKQSMADLITPTGTFTIDLVLTGAGGAVDPSTAAGLATDPEYAALLADPVALLANMNRIDFDGDGAPDRAYGVAYVGLTAEDQVTGPKLRRYRDGTAYWFSIALHGTPDPANIGAAGSGGCVHLPAELLTELIAAGTLAVGRAVIIQDGAPQ